MLKSQEQLNNNIKIPLLVADLKVALVHDFLDQYGGAERVLEVLSEMFPEAPIYTLLYDPERMRGKFADREIQTSFLQKFPLFLRKRKKWLLPFIPTAPETFNLRDFDLIISSSGAWSKGIVTRLNTLHVSYIHSPMRFVWDANEEYLGQVKNSKLKGQSFFARLILNYVRLWDKAASDRPDFLIANSLYTQRRIKKYYGRESVVIYPPINVIASEDANDNLHWSAAISMQANNKMNSMNELKDGIATVASLPRNDSYFLVVSRLSAYKKIDSIIEAFNKLELPLLIVGEGTELENLKSMAGKNIQFLGWQDEKELKEIYANARAFVFAADDDFGIAPIEAMAYGVPVVALKKGGVLETVIEGKTGEFFASDTPEIIADAVRKLVENEKKYDKEFIKNRAAEFSKERFVRELNDFLESILKSS